VCVCEGVFGRVCVGVCVGVLCLVFDFERRENAIAVSSKS